MTAQYSGFRTLDVLVPANDWSATITTRIGEGVAMVYFPSTWTVLASLLWSISPDGGTNFIQVYDAAGNPSTFHSNAGPDEAHDNLFSCVGQWDKLLRVKPSAAQSADQTVIFKIIEFPTYHALGAYQGRLPRFRDTDRGVGHADAETYLPGLTTGGLLL